ncbi:MAG TPA: hypothetical protein VHD56_06125 [Tepidisphaeraceae bacterium]|nr:hypothetical protein [Tepidisphaeraceae bacterium]
MKTSRLLGVVVVLQLMLLAGQWLGSPILVAPAQAQAVDAARDRMQTLEELRNANTKLDKIIDLLGNGGLQVRVVQPDEMKGKPAAR